MEERTINASGITTEVLELWIEGGSGLSSTLENLNPGSERIDMVMKGERIKQRMGNEKRLKKLMGREKYPKDKKDVWLGFCGDVYGYVDWSGSMLPGSCKCKKIEVKQLHITMNETARYRIVSCKDTWRLPRSEGLPRSSFTWYWGMFRMYYTR